MDKFWFSSILNFSIKYKTFRKYVSVNLHFKPMIIIIFSFNENEIKIFQNRNRMDSNMELAFSIKKEMLPSGEFMYIFTERDELDTRVKSKHLI